MLRKVREYFSSFFSRGNAGGDSEGVYDLLELHAELQELIVRNEVRLAENEKLISKVLAASKEEEQKVCNSDSDFEKRAALRRVRSHRKRVERLSRCSNIYHDNINMQTAISERLEDMRVQGMKTVSADLLSEMAVDYEEMYNKHRDLVNSVQSMGGRDFAEPESFEDDPELRDLAQEHGLL